jgi:COP9 signalosome complex subunit 2
MKAVYNETLKLNAVINDPRVMAIIREAGGKIFMNEKKWAQALDELFESFKSYQESGNTRAKTVLKYVILASILADSKIDYSQTREAKVYMEDKQIIAITQLRSAFEQNNINQIQKILHSKDSHILDDPFINQYLDDLLRNIRLNVIVARVKPYKTVSLDFLCQELTLPREDICGLLSELILEEKIKGEIDQLNGFLEMS